MMSLLEQKRIDLNKVEDEFRECAATISEHTAIVQQSQGVLNQEGSRQLQLSGRIIELRKYVAELEAAEPAPKAPKPDTGRKSRRTQAAPAPVQALAKE